MDVKDKRYKNEFDKRGYDFTAVVFETYGAVCDKGMDIIKFVARAVASCRNISISLATKRLTEQLSCGLMKFNALMVLECDPPPPNAMTCLLPKHQLTTKSLFVGTPYR